MKKILILAAGGGFDVLTIQMIKKKLMKERENIIIDTAGWLNPKFAHSFRYDEYEYEKAINLGFHDVQRFRRKKEKCYKDSPMDYYNVRIELEQKSMIDNELVHLNYQICDFSTKYGLKEISQYVMSYDELLVCDVGGDMLYHGYDNNEVKTPQIDGFSIALLDKVRDYMPTSCVVVCPGVDMGLTCNHLDTCFCELDSKKGIIKSSSLGIEDITFLKKLFDSIENKSYGGNTIRRILDEWNILKETRPVQNEKILNCRKWFIKLIEINADAICEYSPFSKCETMFDIDQILKINRWLPACYGYI